jgi:hypothetical protein
MVATRVICATDGCENQGIALVIESSGIDPDGNPFTVDAVFCGACSQPIDDITPPLGEE